MIIQISQTKKCPIAKKLNWKQSLKRELYRKNMSSFKQNEQLLKRQDSLGKKQAVKSLLSVFRKTNILLNDPPLHNQCHSYYSSFIPLKIQSRFDDQFIVTFPYFEYLNDNCLQNTKSNCYNQISTLMRKSREEGTISEGWQTCLDQYLCGIDSIRAIELYLELLKKGTSILSSLHLIYGGKCNKEVFFHKINQASVYFKPSPKLNKSLNISIDLTDVISEVTIAKTMKQMFCVICLNYDCGQHHIEDKAVDKYMYQYVSHKNAKTRKEHLINAVKICEAHRRIIQDCIVPQKNFCSNKCYLHLNASKLQKLEKESRKLLSPLIKGLIKIGVQMFSYVPCDIWNTLTQTKVTCQLVFLYFIEEYNIYKRIQRKLYQTEYEQLLSQKSMEVITAIPTQAQPKKGKKTITSKIAQYSANSYHHSLGTCFHFFVNQEPFDLNCQNCICKERGFCLPQCMCDDACPIKKKGCTCKKDQCQTKKCACFVNKQECLPGICLSCYGSKEISKKNNCSNNKILLGQKKLIKIGKSSIGGAGLGAFAGQFIKKDSLVTIYTGQIIDPQIDSLRESLSYDLSFYNFASPQGTIDARYMGNKSRFINHGDLGEQNLRAQVMFSDGRYKIGFYAERDIEKGEEFLFDYDGQGELFKNHKHKYPFIKSKKRAKQQKIKPE